MKLVIAPHADDEVLGCSSLLDKDTYVYYLGINEFHIVSYEERIKEIEKVANFFGFNYCYDIHTVDAYDFKNVLDGIQNKVNKLKPEEIYIPHPSYNQDHRTTFNAAFTAIRPHDKNFFVKKALVYEQVHPNLWDNQMFKPNHFKDLDINQKINGYELHRSQVREHRSIDRIITLATWRGYQSDFRYAEGFRILRWI